jgi:hypothetical protein
MKAPLAFCQRRLNGQTLSRRNTMSTPRRFLNGITNVAIDNPLGRLPYLDPTKWAIWFDDFLHYDVAQGDAAWILDMVWPSTI